MKQDKALLTLALLLAPFFLSSVAAAQSAKPTADQDIQLSAFGAASADYTGLSGGRNLSVTAGIDLALAPWHGMRPTLELRGTYPMDKGEIVAQKDGLGGLRLDFLLGRRVHPYGDFLFGRGEMNYEETCSTSNGPGNGYRFNNTCYSVTTTYVYSPGAGFDYDLTNHIAIKVDGQYQQWGAVPTASGKLYSTLGSIGLVYRFGKFGMP
jgi:opacity protein-like surface antigen